MRIVNMHEAKTHFSKLVDSVLHGNEVMIAMAGKPVAKLVPIEKKPKRRLGVLRDRSEITFTVSEGKFDSSLEDFSLEVLV